MDESTKFIVLTVLFTKPITSIIMPMTIKIPATKINVDEVVKSSRIGIAPINKTRPKIIKTTLALIKLTITFT